MIVNSKLLRGLKAGGLSPAATPSAFFADLPVLETPDLIIRPMHMRDARDIFAYASDPQVSRFVLWDPHRTLADTRAYIRYVRHGYRWGRPSSWAIVCKANSRVIGSIGIMAWSPVHHAAEIGYSLSREYWNRGLTTQALCTVIHSLFTALPDLNRLEAQHDIRNPASGRVMEKCGMKYEGILRSRLYNKNEFVDVALYAILRSDLLP